MDMFVWQLIAPVVYFMLSSFAVFICVLTLLDMRILHVLIRQTTVYTIVGPSCGFTVVL